jgi:hypothetical protein
VRARLYSPPAAKRARRLFPRYLEPIPPVLPAERLARLRT